MDSKYAIQATWIKNLEAWVVTAQAESKPTTLEKGSNGCKRPLI